MQGGYQSIVVDLSTVFESLEIVRPGVSVSGIVCNDLTTGARCKVAVGTNPFFTVASMMALAIDGEANDSATTSLGVRVQNITPQPGASVEFLVLFGTNVRPIALG